jgi:hypothetical protein
MEPKPRSIKELLTILLDNVHLIGTVYEEEDLPLPLINGMCSLAERLSSKNKISALEYYKIYKFIEKHNNSPYLNVNYPFMFPICAIEPRREWLKAKIAELTEIKKQSFIQRILSIFK